jgi:transcriptional regulator with XRE-family HTH domain
LVRDGERGVRHETGGDIKRQLGAVREDEPVRLSEEMPAPQDGARAEVAMSTGGRVRRARRHRGMTLEVAAGRIGKSKGWLSVIENGRLQLDRLSDITALAAVLRVPVPTLIGARAPAARAPRQVATVAGDILSPGQRRAVEELTLAWGGRYDIGSAGGRYYARRDDGTGEALEGDTPDALDTAMRADRAREVTS